MMFHSYVAVYQGQNLPHPIAAIATPAQPQRSHLHLVARRPQQHSATALAAPEAVGAAVEGQAAPMGTQETTWGMALPEPFSWLKEGEMCCL